ncbi:MAG: hypothetical protein ACRD2B_03565 [Terriglobia bacterium]
MKKWFLASVALCALALSSTAAPASKQPAVRLIRVPNGGIQPQVAVDARETLHLIYFKGDPSHGNIFYVHSKDWGRSFSRPMRVNSKLGTAVALGTIRGAHIAVGKSGRVYVSWNGSSLSSLRGPLDPDMARSSPYNALPMLYTRLNDAGRAFEKPRNLMKLTFGLDGGGSVAADRFGNVYVAWHGKRAGDPSGEAGRSVWIACSEDGGRDFAPEITANRAPTGACGCCGLSIFAGKNGTVYILYRSAAEMVHRNVYLLVSRDDGRTFAGRLVDRWNIGACPMTSMAFAQGPHFVVGAWQTKKEIYYARINPATLEMSAPNPAPGGGKLRKYPALAVNSDGDVLLVWTEGTSWSKGGALAWQVFNRQGEPLGGEGKVNNLPAWSFGAVYARPDGDFTIVY